MSEPFLKYPGVISNLQDIGRVFQRHTQAINDLANVAGVTTPATASELSTAPAQEVEVVAPVAVAGDGEDEGLVTTSFMKRWSFFMRGAGG